MSTTTIKELEATIGGLESYGLTVSGPRRSRIAKLVKSFKESINRIVEEREEGLCTASCTYDAIRELDGSINARFASMESKLDAVIPERIFEGRPFPPAESGATSTIVDLGDHCPGFYGEFQSSRKRWDPVKQKDVHWATMCKFVPFRADVKAWIERSPVWSLNGGDRLSDGRRVVRATCAVGGNTQKYIEQIKNGGKRANQPFTRGHPSRIQNGQECVCCGCELRVTYTEGENISLIEVKLHEETIGERTRFRTHCHGELNNVIGAGVSATLIQMDPSLFVHNLFTSLAMSRDIAPATILTRVISAVIDRNENNAASIVRQLSHFRCKKLARDYCKRIRGRNQRMNVEELLNAIRKRDREHRRLCSSNPLKARHMPRVIGFSRKFDEYGQLSHLALTFSSTSMLEAALKGTRSQALMTDCTFKRIQAGYPLLCIGFKPPGRCFRLSSVSIVLRENTDAYKSSLTHLKNAVELYFHEPFCPPFIMADTAASITSAARQVLPDTRRLVCYTHMLRSVRGYFRYKCGITSDEDWNAFRAKLVVLAASKSPDEFQRYVGFLAEDPSVTANEALLAYVTKPGGYFDSSSWRSKWHLLCYDDGDLGELDCPRSNNAMEGTNNRIKISIFGHEIRSFAVSIDALMGEHMVRFSTEADLPLESGPDYSKRSLLWRMAYRNQNAIITHVAEKAHFLRTEVPVEGDLFAVGGDRETVQLQLSVDFNPFSHGARPLVPLVYLPPASEGGSTMGLSPLAGGPICSCDYFSGRSVCWHICLLYIRQRDVVVPEHQARIGAPNPAYGRYRARRPTSALHRMESRDPLNEDPEDA